MVYLLETDLTNDKPLFLALSEVYGIGLKQSVLFCKKLGFSKDIKVHEITNFQKKKIVSLISNSSFLDINSELKRKLKFDNKRLLSIKSYRGIRKYKGFPVRGQRTKTNSKTAKKSNWF
tara:strand:+ start:291 stop:647 length:357 start_codon:yes stop_codon:yes gene_type:complete